MPFKELLKVKRQVNPEEHVEVTGKVSAKPKQSPAPSPAENCLDRPSHECEGHFKCN